MNAIKKTILEHKRWKFLTAILLIICMIIPVNLGNMFALTYKANQKDFPFFTGVTINLFDSTSGDLNGTPLTNGSTLNVTDAINATYAFEITDSMGLNLDTSYTFDLPEQVTCNTTSDFMLEGVKRGTVTVEGNKAKIEFNAASGLGGGTGNEYALLGAIGSFQISQIKFKSTVQAGNSYDFDFGTNTYNLTFNDNTEVATGSLTNTGTIHNYDMNWENVFSVGSDTTVDSLGKVTLVSTLEGGQTYVPGTAAVKILNSSDSLVGSITPSGSTDIPNLTVTGNVISYTYPGTLSKTDKLVLTYQTKPTLSDFSSGSDVTYSTSTSASFVYGTASSSGSVTAQEADVTFNAMSETIFMTYLNAYKNTHTVSWQININDGSDNLGSNGLFINDLSSFGLSFNPDSITITSADVSDIPYELNPDNTVLKVQLPTLTGIGYTISFDTFITAPEKWAVNKSTMVSNTCYLFCPSGYETSSDKRSYLSDMIKLSYASSFFDFSNNTASWDIKTNTNKLKVKDGSVVLTVPANQELFSVTDSSSNALVFEKGTTNGDGSTNYTVHFGKTISTIFNIIAKTKVVSHEILSKNGTANLKLDATLKGTIVDTSGDIPIPDTNVSSNSTKTFDNVFIKKSASASGNAILWSASINAGRAEFSTLTIEDVLQTGLFLDESSINLYSVSSINPTTGALTKGELVSSDKYNVNITESGSNTKLTVSFPDGLTEAYILEYKTLVESKKTYTNTIAKAGFSDAANSSTCVFDASSLSVIASGTLKRASLKLHKYAMENETMVSLSGAVFHLTLLRSDGTPLTTREFTTNASGNATVTNLPYGNYIIKEITPPTGYTGTYEDTLTISDSTVEGGFYTSTIEVENEKIMPSPSPSVKPSVAPSSSASTEPSVAPSSSASTKPSVAPSSSASTEPSVAPSSSASTEPSVAPSSSASAKPSVAPSSSASAKPSVKPSSSASVKPSVKPSSSASVKPSVKPSSSASVKPSRTPSQTPTVTPGTTKKPTVSSTPEVTPTVTNSAKPSTKPGKEPENNGKRAKLTIIIRDKKNGKPIPNAKAKVVNKVTKKSYSITTNPEGKAITSIPSGTYTIIVEKVPKSYSKPSNLEIKVKPDKNKILEIKVSSGSKGKDKNKADHNAPKTGEENAIPIFLLFAVISGGVIIICKKKQLI